MNDKLTQKTQEAIQSAQETALRYSHQCVDVPHLLLALLTQENGLIPGIFEKVGANVATVTAAVETLLERLPRVTGQSTESGKIYVSQEFQTLLVKAGDQATRLKDEYVSVEHVLLAMLEGDKPRIEFIAAFPEGAQSADAFVEGPGGAYVPMPKKVAVAGRNVTYALDLAGVDLADIKGKDLTVTLVSDGGQAEVVLPVK